MPLISVAILPIAEFEVRGMRTEKLPFFSSRKTVRMSSASSGAMPCAWRRSLPLATRESRDPDDTRESRDPDDILAPSVPFPPAPEAGCPVSPAFKRRGLLALGTAYLYTKPLCQSQTNHGTHSDQVHPSLSITCQPGKMSEPTRPGPPRPTLPRYGSRSLGELVPSLLGSLGAPGFANLLAIEPAGRVCFLLVDGLGWELLQANQAAAPFLNSIARPPLTAGFPATTAASLSSLGIGVPPGEHGLIGYTNLGALRDWAPGRPAG